MIPQRNATQRNATQRNATQRNATQRNATQIINKAYPSFTQVKFFSWKNSKFINSFSNFLIFGGLA